MFGRITKLFRRSAPQRQDPPPTPFSPAQKPDLGERAASPAYRKTAASATGGDSASIPFSAILQLVPAELHGKVNALTLAGASFSIPKAKVLEQISHGAVKVSFGELRQAAPAGVFVASSTHDNKLIDLPLAEILSQFGPDAFPRNPKQKTLTAPEDIADLFGCNGQPLAQVRVIGKNELTQVAAPAGPALQNAPKAAVPVAAGLSAHTSISAPSAPIKAVASAARSAQPSPAAPIPFPKHTVAPPPSAPQNQKRKPDAPSAPSLAGGSMLVVGLAELSKDWPEMIQEEIAQLGLSEAACEIPVEEIGPALKTGKVQCQWKQIRSWITPSISAKTSSSHGETNLELPLKVLAPLYLEQCRSSLSSKKVSAGTEMPDVFNKVDKQAHLPPAPAITSPVPPPSPVPAKEPIQTKPAAAAPKAAAPVKRPAHLSLPLVLVAEKWPDQVRKEVERYHLSDAKIEIPFDILEEGMKLGRLHFRWKEVCRWLNPAPPQSMSSANLDTQSDYRVELPLSFVAPLYLQYRPASTQKKASTLAEIPDVFSSDAQPSTEPVSSVETEAAESAPAPAPSAPVQPASPIQAEQDAPAQASRKPSQDLAELFGEPGKRNWTPNEIVHKTATLPGVAGALIALQDGLLVANCMPPTWKTETIAAFLPQIFGRLSQYTSELKMGDLQSITFAVDHGSLQIFNAGIIYFAALGLPNVALPIQELNLIVKEISRHTK